MASDDNDRPQIYLITPTDPDADSFGPVLEQVLDAVPVACLRLRTASYDEALVSRTADRFRGIAHERDVPLVIDAHAQLVTRLGLDGVHLADGAKSVRKAREALGAEAIVGAFCGTSRHDGMNAGEAGADYVAFGPAGDTPLGSGAKAEVEMFAWWSEMIELPVVAEGALSAEAIAALAPVTDFFGIGDEIWGAEDPAVALRSLMAQIV